MRLKMVPINFDMFILENNKQKVFNNITTYCSNCYKEFKEDEAIYLNTTTYEYICHSCALYLSEKINIKEIYEEYQKGVSLF